MLLAAESTSTDQDQLSELHRQVDVLIDRGYPALAGMSESAFRAIAAPLERRLPEQPFVLVVTEMLVGVHQRMALTALKGRQGFTTMTAEELGRFTPTDDLDRPPVATQHPEWLRDRNCFEMLGSRAGDKRVTGIRVSKGSPRLGWCWMGNPHTWLGMATAGGRVG